MEIKVPEVGESVREALLAKWFRQDGATVTKDEPLCEIETDKITLDIPADASGTLTITVTEGTTVRIGAVVGTISEQDVQPPQSITAAASAESPPMRDSGIAPSATSPSVRSTLREQGIDPASITGTGKNGRITNNDLSQQKEVKGSQASVSQTDTAQPIPQAPSSPVLYPSRTSDSAEHAATLTPADTIAVSSIRTEDPPLYTSSREDRKKMSPIRKRISERLLAARQQTAMLTTFNEADLSHVKALRERYREHFKSRHGIGLGFMSFFVRACCEALKEFPAVNSRIDGDDLVYHKYFDIGVAIGAEKGLVVPVLRNADRMRLHEIEQVIADFSEKIRTNRLAISDLEGGTFSISNGGVYGSMLSTPILNPPQSGVLGMHAIQDRAVVRDGQIVIRPMMYLALSYDHRIVDGREAVGFLKKVKEFIEEPEELLLES